MSKRKARYNIILDNDPNMIAKSCRTYWGARYWLWFVDDDDRKGLTIVECTQVVIP